MDVQLEWIEERMVGEKLKIWVKDYIIKDDLFEREVRNRYYWIG